MIMNILKSVSIKIKYINNKDKEMLINEQNKRNLRIKRIKTNI